MTKAFLFLLRDRARAWIYSLAFDSIMTWDHLKINFLTRYFLQNKITQLRNQITSFIQKDEEYLYESWVQFKEMLTLSSHHGLEIWLIVDTFCNRLLYTTRMTVDATACGAFMNKSIENMAQNHYQ